MEAVRFQDVWVVPNPDLVPPFQYLDKFKAILNGFNNNLIMYLTNEVGLTEGLANAVKGEIGTVSHTQPSAFSRQDAIVLFYTIVKVLRKKMPLKVTVAPVIGSSKTTVSDKDAKVTYDEAKAFLTFMQTKTSYLKAQVIDDA